MQNGVWKLVFLALFVSAVVSTPVMAQVAVDGGSGLFNTQKAKTLGHLELRAGAFYQTSNYDDPGEIDSDELPVSLTLGLQDRFELSVAVPWRRMDPKGASSESGLSDGIARAKWNFYTSDKHNLRFSAIAMVTLPLGDKDKGLGTDKTNLGVALAVDKEYEKISWHANLGFMGRQEENMNDQVLYAAGVEWKPVDSLGLIAEVSGFSFTSAEKYMDDNTKVMGGLRYYLDGWGSVSAGYGSWGGGDGPGSPNYMYMVGVSVGFGGKREKPVEKEKVEAPAPAPKPAPKPAPAPAPRMAAPKPAPKPEKVTITLEPVHFKFDSAELTDEAKEILRRHAEKVRENEGSQLTIEGHACWIGTRKYNKWLGHRRAIAAKKFLMSLGIDADRMVLMSFGEEKPVGDNRTREGRKKNRRADFIIKIE